MLEEKRELHRLAIATLKWLRRAAKDMKKLTETERNRLRARITNIQRLLR